MSWYQGAVPPQHERRPIASIGRAKGDVLAQMHKAQLGRLDAKRRMRLRAAGAYALLCL